MFLFIGIASFRARCEPSARLVMPYYGAHAGVLGLGGRRCHASAGARRPEGEAEALPGRLRQLRAAKNAQAAEMDVDGVRHALAEKRLIIVARDQVDLYDRIRKRSAGTRGGQGYHRPPKYCPSSSDGGVSSRPPAW